MPVGYTVVTKKTYGSLKGARAFANKYSASQYIRQISKIGGSTWEVLILDKSKPLANPAKGKWIKVRAVKINRNGSISLRK